MKTTHILCSLLFALAALGLANGCDGGREGERCNPSLSHDECNDGLTCQVTTSCGESYCCPSNPASSSSPYCNGNPGVNASCPTPDAGVETGGGDAASE
jgi:hypothetical protein